AAQLGDSLAALLDAKSLPVGAPRSLEASGIEQQGGKVDLPHGGRIGGVGGIVDEDGKRHLLVGDKGFGVVLVAGSDGDDLGTGPGDLVIGASQLRGVLSTEQSAEVTEKDQDHRTVSPKLAQAVRAPIGTDEF